MDNNFDDFFSSEELVEVTGGFSDPLEEKRRRRALGIPYEIFSTERCIVREICPDDIDRLFEIYEAPEIRAYLNDIHESKEEEIQYTHQYIRYRYDVYHYGAWMVEEKKSHQVIGRAGLNYKKDQDIVELSYMICKECQGQGLAYEVCLGILDYARNPLGIQTLYARVNAGNRASLGLIRKLGFTEIGSGGSDHDGEAIIRFRKELM